MTGKVTSSVEKGAAGLGLDDAEGLGHQLCLPLAQASSFPSLLKPQLQVLTSTAFLLQALWQCFWKIPSLQINCNNTY